MEGREEPFRVEYPLLGCVRSLFLTRYLRSTLNEVSGVTPKADSQGPVKCPVRGGALIRLLTRHGLSTTAARKWVMTICLLLVSCAVWVRFIQSEALVIALLCLAATGSAAYMVNYFAFGQDVAPSHTGLVIGYLGGLGNLFAAGFMPVAGWISQGRSGFTPNFIVIGLLPLAGLAALLAFWGQDNTKPAWTDR